MSEQWVDVLTDGLERYAALSGDPDYVRMGLFMAKKVAGAVHAKIQPQEQCTYAYTTVALLDGGPTRCLVMIFGERVEVFWETGKIYRHLHRSRPHRSRRHRPRSLRCTYRRSKPRRRQQCRRPLRRPAGSRAAASATFRRPTTSAHSAACRPRPLLYRHRRNPCRGRAPNRRARATAPQALAPSAANAGPRRNSAAKLVTDLRCARVESARKANSVELRGPRAAEERH